MDFIFSGATLYIIPDSVIYDPTLLCGYLKKHEITRMLFTPSLFEAFLDAEATNIKESLKTMRYGVFMVMTAHFQVFGVLGFNHIFSTPIPTAHTLVKKRNSSPFHLQILKLPDGVQARNGLCELHWPKKVPPHFF